MASLTEVRSLHSVQRYVHVGVSHSSQSKTALGVSDLQALINMEGIVCFEH